MFETKGQETKQLQIKKGIEKHILALISSWQDERGSAVLALKLQEEWVQVNLKSHLPQFLGILNSLQPGSWEFLIGWGVIKHQLNDNIDVSSIGTISQGDVSCGN